MVLEQEAIRRAFEGRLGHRWLDALVLYESVLVASHEMGSEFAQHHRDGAVKEQDLVFEAVVRLQGRTCLTASEIMCLLRSGYPFGAHPRWRTMHELAVVAGPIARSGREIAERYCFTMASRRLKPKGWRESSRPFVAGTPPAAWC